MSTLLEQASLVMVPSGYKEDTVYSVVPSDGSGDLNFTRASNGTRVNSAGLVEVCPWNLLEQSETIGTSPWNVSGYALTSNATTAPNGTNTAELFTLNNGNVAGASYSINQGLPISGAITISVYFKNNNSTGKYVLQTGSAQGSDINVVTLAITNFGTGCIGSVESVGNGWYRFSTFIPSASSPYFFSYQDGMTGDGSKGIYLWGAQINYGALKPYFPTTDRLNVPRLTYQNGGGGCPSLLLEKQSTNTLSYSQDFTDAIWLKGSGLSVTGNTTTSPDGTQNAGTITNTATSNCFLYQLASTSATTWTMSLYAKKGTNKYLGITLCSATYQATSRYQPVFNLDNGTLQTINQSGSNETNTSYSITAVGDGWYRLTATATFVAGADQCYIVLQSSNNTSYNPASGNLDWTTPTTGNYYLWGAQLEASSYPTSYIPTTSASATRVADACSKTGISSLIGQTEGVIFADINYQLSNPDNDTRIHLSDGSTNKWIFLGLPDGATGNSIRGYVNNASASFGLSFYGSTTLTIGRHKIAFAYKSGDFAIYLDGVSVATNSTTGTIPTCSELTIGGATPTSITQTEIGQFNQVTLFPTRLTNAELASLTTI